VGDTSLSLRLTDKHICSSQLDTKENITALGSVFIEPNDWLEGLKYLGVNQVVLY
jgi:hypothetical protein